MTKNYIEANTIIVLKTKKKIITLRKENLTIKKFISTVN